METRLRQLGYQDHDLQRLRDLTFGGLGSPQEIAHLLDRVPYREDWRSSYRVKSVRASLHDPTITCIDGAILAYGLLDFFPRVTRRLLAIHRRAPAGEECGHVVTLYWGDDGCVGAFSKSSLPGLGHRPPIYADEAAIATSYAEAYLKLGMRPLYYAVMTLEDAAGDLDWRFCADDMNALSSRIQARYEYAFDLAGDHEHARS